MKAPTPKILSMPPTRIEEKNKEETRNQPFVLDNRARAHYSEASEARRGPNDSRSQGTSKIVIVEFNSKFDNLLSIGALV